MPGLAIRPFPEDAGKRPDSIGAQCCQEIGKERDIAIFIKGVFCPLGKGSGLKGAGPENIPAKRFHGAPEAIIWGSIYAYFGNPGKT